MWPQLEARSGDAPPERRGARQAVRRLHIVTVHGTWGRGFLPDTPHNPHGRRAAWCTVESAFIAEMGRGLGEGGTDYKVSDFLWSGANSITERDKAASILANSLAECLCNEPDTHLLVVAHSHGGNVALRALHLLRERLGSGRKQKLGLSLVTLATPFVQIGSTVNSWFKIFAVLNTTLMVLLSAFSLIPGVSTGIGLLTIISGFAVSLLLLRLMLIGVGFGRVDDPSTFPPALIEASYYPPYDGGFEFLIVRGVEDEASMALMFGALGNRIVDVLIAISAYLIIVSGIALIVVAAVHYWALVLGYDIPTAGPLAFTFWMLLGVSCCVYLGTRFAAFCRSLFGRELYASPLELAVSANTVPDLRALAQVITLPRLHQADISLLHSLYNHERCAQEIVCWLNERRASRDVAGTE